MGLTKEVLPPRPAEAPCDLAFGRCARVRVVVAALGIVFVLDALVRMLGAFS